MFLPLIQQDVVITNDIFLYVYFFHAGIHVSEDSGDSCLDYYKMLFSVLYSI